MSSVLYATPPPLPPQPYPMPIDPYTGFGIYVAKADETCQRVGGRVGGAARVRERERATAHLTGAPAQIGKQLGFDADELVAINKSKFFGGPPLLLNSKLKKGTEIWLPKPDLRWILTKQISRHKPEGKKKRVYTVHDVDNPNDTYHDIESYRVQDFPQLGNTYEKDEVVSALYPAVAEPSAADSTHWLTEFYTAIYIMPQPGDRALLKFENDARSLDHNEPSLQRRWPVRP